MGLSYWTKVHGLPNIFQGPIIYNPTLVYTPLVDTHWTTIITILEYTISLESFQNQHTFHLVRKNVCARFWKKKKTCGWQQIDRSNDKWLVHNFIGYCLRFVFTTTITFGLLEEIARVLSVGSFFFIKFSQLMTFELDLLKVVSNLGKKKLLK